MIFTVPKIRTIFLDFIAQNARQNKDTSFAVWHNMTDFYLSKKGINLQYFCEKFGTLPDWFVNKNNDISFVITAQLLQHYEFGGTDVKTHYCENLLKTAFDFEFNVFAKMKVLMDLRFFHSQQNTSFVPYNLMHDLNLVQISYEYPRWMTILTGLQNDSKEDMETFMKRQISIVRYLLHSGEIFHSVHYRESSQNNAIKNLQHFRLDNGAINNDVNTVRLLYSQRKASFK